MVRAVETANEPLSDVLYFEVVLGCIWSIRWCRLLGVFWCGCGVYGDMCAGEKGGVVGPMQGQLQQRESRQQERRTRELRQIAGGLRERAHKLEQLGGVVCWRWLHPMVFG